MKAQEPECRRGRAHSLAAAKKPIGGEIAYEIAALREETST
jgi:hypothetical protein